jgi:hypothetical protein
VQSDDSSIIIVALMLTPLVTYLILSGRVGQLKAGGLEAKFISAAQEPVRVNVRTVEAALKPVQVAERGLIAELPERLKKLEPGEPVILTVKLGQQYRREDWLEYVRAILDRASLVYAAVLDDSGRLIAYMRVPALRQLLGSLELGGAMIRAIAQRDVATLMSFPGVETRALDTSATTLNALRLFRERGVDTLLTVDADKRIAGILKRDDIVAQIILDMAQ